MTMDGKYRWITIGAAAGLAGAVLMIALFYILPVYIETRLIPRWASDAGLTPGAINIRRVDFNGADAGPIRIDFGDAPFLEIAAVQIDYSLRSLLERRIDAVVLGGLNLTLTLNAQGNAIVGWEPRPQPHEPQERLDLKTMLPIELGHVAVRNATITIHWQGRTLRAAMDADLNAADLRQGRLHGSMRLNIRGSRFNIIAAADDRTNQIDLRLEGREVSLTNFSDLLAAYAQTEASGRLDLTADAVATLRPTVLTSFKATGHLAQTRIDKAGLRLENTTDVNGAEQPLFFALQADEGRNWRWSASPFQSTRPLTMRVDGLEGQITVEKSGLHASADALTVLTPQTLILQGQPPVIIASPLALHWVLSAGTTDDQTVVFEAHAATKTRTGDDLLSLRMEQAAFKGRAPYLKLDGRYNDGGAQVRFETGLAEVHASHPQGTAAGPGISITGEVHTGSSHRIDMLLNLPDVQADLNGTTVSLPKTRLEAQMSGGGGEDWRMQGKLDLDGVRARNKANDVGVEQLSIRLPLQWPAAPAGSAGTVKAGAVLWKSRDMGGITGTAVLRPDGLHADLDHASKLFPGLNVHIQTTAGESGTAVIATIPSYAPSSAVDLGRIIPAAAGMTVNGRIEAQVRMAMRNGSFAGEARFGLEQGKASHTQTQLVLEGIACKLHIADLAALRSAPGQRLNVERLTMGKIEAQNMAVDFQIEPQNTLFIEKAAMSWCGGTVGTTAVRLKPDLKEVTATLLCDRLNLAMLLEQLGAARGSGEGSVNGSIPLRWQKGLLSFDKGFLYSTPGQTGSIQLEDTQFLLAGLPPGSPQHIQLDIATEALKDYSYNWAKLNLTSQDDRLLLSLQLDGKPNQLLPFAYQPETGRFERVEGRGQADFKGIGFTLNFNTPLNEILNYKDLLTPKER